MEFVVYNKLMQNKLSTSFKCGNDYLDNFLKTDEAFNTRFGKTYVYLNDEKNGIIAYFNIGTGSIVEKGDDIKNEMKMGGSVHLNCFALDTKYQGKSFKIDKLLIKFSEYIFSKCIKVILDIKNKYIGFSFITLYSTKAGYKLYKKFGFVDIEEDMVLPKENSENKCVPMYLPIMDI